MLSIKLRDLLHSAQNDPKKLGYYTNMEVLLECLDGVLNTDVTEPQRNETFECRLIQALTKNAIKV